MVKNLTIPGSNASKLAGPRYTRPLLAGVMATNNMKVTKLNEEYKPTSDRLGNIESLLGCRLPDSYRAFLIENDWCMVEPCGFAIGYLPETNNMKTNDQVEAFYGLHEPDDEPSNLIWNYRCFSTSERIPKQLIAIGSTCGNQLCIGISGEYRGKIYWWSQHFELEQESFENCTLLADSFDSFLSQLRE
ncbi:SMI1/KNR4 family protein [Motilimonas eburnea]|uniref:SMI1/KNR4 family protein n=1 Tax=Motilimonas eburnea TaxID=1737488 RepID=UPI001E4BAB9A|nr:SMI1/KNR4 family protein [Motilimonas eburnea]MCE2573420.1 SMI1/KNR4 family protein [Motilimonas eburnea]